MSAENKSFSRARTSLLPGLVIDKNDTRPLYWQIYNEVKRLILSGVVPPGNPMPSPRALAGQLSCSRHTVTTAYEYLVAEGILNSSHGVGTFVSTLSGTISGDAVIRGDRESFTMPSLSRFSNELAQGITSRDEEDPLQVFGMPDTDAFPYDIWSKLYSRIWSQPKTSLVRSVSRLGYIGLREAICELVHRTRGIQAQPEEVLITSGTTQSLDLLMRVLLDAGDSIWVEDPGRPKAFTLIRAMGMQPVPVPVDDRGMDIANGEERAPQARAVLVTASHHYPTGATLSLERRIRLLSWASRTGGWIFEDDYDGELIAAGQPILPIYSLGRTNNTIYMGTFSKSISPQLRIGYIIAHASVIEAVAKARYFLDYFPSMMTQPVLAAFISEGHLDSYIRRMRRAYKDRQSAFIAEMTEHGADLFTSELRAPGLFLPLMVNGPAEPTVDRHLAEAAREVGISAFDLSSFYFQAPARPGIIIGTGRLNTKTIPELARQFIAASRRILTADD